MKNGDPEAFAAIGMTRKCSAKRVILKPKEEESPEAVQEAKFLVDKRFLNNYNVIRSLLR